MFRIVLNPEEDNGCGAHGSSESIREGSRVHRIALLPYQRRRVVNPLGEPIDGESDIEGETVELPLERKAPGLSSGSR